MLIDTHAHLWFPEYDNDLDEVIENAITVGVEKMIVPGTNIESSKKAIELAKKYPGIIYAAVGVHPEKLIMHNSKEETPPTFGVPTRDSLAPPVEEPPLNTWKLSLRSDLLVAREQIVAIGEIGIDLFTEEIQKTLPEQKVLFREQCLLALEYKLPVIIHTRNSFAETWEVLKSLPQMPRGQFHCFSIDGEALKMVIEHGFYVSFGGNITWSKRVARLVNLVPVNRLLLETDSPFMIPRVNGRVAPSSSTREQPSESQNRNEPANVRLLAEKIAELCGQSIQEIEKMTTENANTLYKL